MSKSPWVQNREIQPGSKVRLTEYALRNKDYQLCRGVKRKRCKNEFIVETVNEFYITFKKHDWVFENHEYPKRFFEVI